MKSIIQRFVFAAALAIAAVALAPSQAVADAPSQLPIQGVLADADGMPLDGSAELTLRVYDSTNMLLFTHVTTVSLENGEFSAALGDASNPIDLALFRDNGQLELGISVDGGTELSPRFPIQTAPYAAFSQYSGEAGSVAWSAVSGVPADIGDGDADTTYTAGTALALNGTTFSIPNGGVTGTQIAANAVGSSEIANESITSADIDDGTITGADVAGGTITGGNIQNGSIVGADIADDNIRDVHLATNAVREEHIFGNSVGRSKLAHDIFTANNSLQPAAGLLCVGNNDQTFDVPADTYELCLLSQSSGQGSCRVSYISSTNEWRLYSNCSSTTTAHCFMTCFTW